MQTLKLADDLFPSLLDGTKLCTIRRGERDISLDRLTFENVSETQFAVVFVTSVRKTFIDLLTDEEAQADGAKNAEDMFQSLKRFYPDLEKDSPITIIQFEKPVLLGYDV